MAKFWTAGKVKTRLGQSIGMQQSSRLHKLFVQFLSNSLASSADGRMAVVTPREKARRFGSQISDQWEIGHQSDGDLGQRMVDWFRRSLTDYQSAILIGADCPLIDAPAIQAASDALAENDVVIGPAHDGGYYLIGFNGPWNDRFEQLFAAMPWSSDEVLSKTIQRCGENELAVVTLPQREDIDTADALERLQIQLKSNGKNDSSQRTLSEQIEAILNDSSRDDDMSADSIGADT